MSNSTYLSTFAYASLQKFTSSPGGLSEVSLLDSGGSILNLPNGLCTVFTGLVVV